MATTRHGSTPGGASGPDALTAHALRALPLHGAHWRIDGQDVIRRARLLVRDPAAFDPVGWQAVRPGLTYQQVLEERPTVGRGIDFIVRAARTYQRPVSLPLEYKTGGRRVLHVVLACPGKGRTVDLYFGQLGTAPAPAGGEGRQAGNGRD
jgi:hypothetical protein